MAQHGQQTIQKPLILGVELATRIGSVALVCPELSLFEATLFSRKTHSRTLLGQIDTALTATGLDLQRDIDALAISLGPGSFTGLRIGLATCKGIALAAHIPLIGVSTLEALASQAPATTLQICPILDARKQEVYSALFQTCEDGNLERMTEDMVVAPSTLIANINRSTLFCGDGLTLYRDEIEASLGDTAFFAPQDIVFPRASTVGHLALKKFQDQEFLDLHRATPLYVRASDAELNFG